MRIINAFLEGYWIKGMIKTRALSRKWISSDKYDSVRAMFFSITRCFANVALHYFLICIIKV